MRPGRNEIIPARNTLNMRRIRDVRLPLNIPCWLQKGENIHLMDCLVFESLSLNSVRRNTILPVKPWGFIKPTLPEPPSQSGSNQNSGGSAASLAAPPIAPPAPLPLCTFTDGTESHISSAKLNAVKNLTAQLQDRAFDKLLPHWIFLQDHEKPQWWHERAGENTEDNISIPLLQAIPCPAREWIKECVRDAGEPQSRLTVPPVSILPKSSKAWVTACIKEGRARSPVATSSTVGRQADVISSVDATGSDYSYQSNLSLSLRFSEEEAPGGMATGFSDTNEGSTLSETDSGKCSVPEVSERTEATWTKHWQNHYRAKAVTEALKAGRPGSAVVLSEHTAKVTTIDGRVLVFKNMFVRPEI